jgi:hypothetical protein
MAGMLMEYNPLTPSPDKGEGWGGVLPLWMNQKPSNPPPAPPLTGRGGCWASPRAYPGRPSGSRLNEGSEGGPPAEVMNRGRDARAPQRTCRAPPQGPEVGRGRNRVQTPAFPCQGDPKWSIPPHAFSVGAHGVRPHRFSGRFRAPPPLPGKSTPVA